MPTLTVRNVDKDVKARLVQQAKADGRSLEGYLRRLITDQALSPAPGGPRNLVAESRAVMESAGAFLEDGDIPPRTEFPRETVFE